MEIIYYIPLSTFNIFNIIIYHIKYLLNKKSENLSQNISNNSKFYKIDNISKKLLNFKIIKK